MNFSLFSCQDGPPWMHTTTIPTMEVSSVQEAAADNRESVYREYLMWLRYVGEGNIRSKVQAVPGSKSGRLRNDDTKRRPNQ